ncbi:MAG: WecB/TagA/CpsF family glycosyltransferase [Coriobacteriia bacterium]|nr:WecB/TagA/CpsF family glycosyltransferase [Coriobacteriia bacterium]
MSARGQIFGVPVDPDTMESAILRCRALIQAGQPAQHVVLNAGKVVMMQDVPGLREVIGACDVVHADGQSIVWAGKLLGVGIPERVAGIDLAHRLLAEAEREGWPVYFLGARQPVLDKFVGRVVRRFPMLRIANARNGYFTDDEAVADEIAATGTRLLFVGISSPRKEFFLAEQLPRMGPVFAMGVGGSFDVWAGKARRAPKWIQHLGMEWLYRLSQEPRRMWRRYSVGNLRFLRLLAEELQRRRVLQDDSG